MNRKEIQKWLIDADVTQKQIAKETGVSRPLVCLVIKGERINQAVLDLLEQYGCPKEFLQPKRVNKKGIHIWFIEHDLTIDDIAKSLKISRDTVSLVLMGRKYDPVVMTYLRGLGFPMEYLDGQRKAS